jgi:uncharacterized protein
VAIDPVQGAPILLPILIAHDLVSVAACRRSFDGQILRIMLPGGIIGIGIGYAFAASVSGRAVMTAVGAVSILLAAQRLWADRGHVLLAQRNSPTWVGFLRRGDRLHQ